MRPADDSTLPDDALLALARLLRGAAGCSFVALTPMRNGQPTGPRHAVDLIAAIPRVRSVAAEGITTTMQLPLRRGTDTVGLLELGWQQPQRDADLHTLTDFLPLATLLADDRALRDRVAELQAQVERELPYLRGELRRRRSAHADRRGSGHARRANGHRPGGADR